MATAPARQLATRAVTALGRRADQAIAVLAIGIGGSWLVVDGASSTALYRGGLLLHSVAASAVVVALTSLPRGRVASALSWHPLVWVGVRSYGLYLWHWPVYVVLSTERTGLDGPVLTVVRIAVSTILAAASFRFVEDPMRHRVTWVRDRRGIPALAGAIALVAATLIVLPHPRREIAAFDPGSITVPSMTTPAITTPLTESHDPVPTLGPPRLTGPSTVLPAIERPATTSTTSSSSRNAEHAPPAPHPTTSAPTTSSSTTVAPIPPASPAIAAAAVLTKRPITSVLWTGDSIAYDLAPGVGAALAGAGLLANSNAYPGMRLVGGDQFSLLPKLRADLPTSGIDVVVVQLSVWDAQRDAVEQQAALAELHALAVSNEVVLVLVSSPPTVDLAVEQGLVGLTEHARAIAAAHPTTTVFLDAAAVWGSVFDADLDDDGTPERKRDGAHVCPSGAARFALWLTAELASRFDGLAPTPPTEWATGNWVTDGRYDQPVGSCAALSD
jgi:hypothetical protein